MKLKFITIIILASIFLVKLSNAQKKVLTTNLGHTGIVENVAFSSDGKYIISCSSDKTIKLWEVKSGKRIRTFKGHNNYINTVAFSHNVKYIVSSGRGRTIKLWNTKTGEEIRTFNSGNNKPEIYSLAFSPSDKYIVSGGNNDLTIWDTATGNKTKTLKGHNNAVINSVAYSNDSKYIVSGSSDKTIKLWNAETGEEIKTFIGHNDEVRSVTFSPNGKYILSGSLDRSIKLWDIETGQEIKTFKGKSFWIFSVAYSPNGKYIVGSGPKIIELWDVESGQKIKTFKGHKSNINSVSFSPNGKYIVSGSKDKTIKLWNIESGQKIKNFGAQVDAISSIATSPDGKYIVYGGAGKTIRLLNTDNWHEKHFYKLDNFLSRSSNFIRDIAFSSDSKHIVYSSSDETIELRNIESGQIIKTFTGNKFTTNSIDISPNGKYVVSGDATLKLWNTEKSEQEMRILKGHTSTVNSVAFSSDGKYIVSGSKDKTIKLWNTETGQEIKNFKSGAAFSVAFSPDDKFIISAYADISFWDIKTGEKIKTLKGHTDYVYSLAFSSDGKYIISGSKDKTIKLWDTKTGQEIRTFIGIEDNVNSVIFSQDDKYIFSGSSDGSIKIWNVSTEKLLITRKVIKNSEDWIAITPDGRFDGTEKGMELLYYIDGMNTIPLSSLYEHYYTPNLLARVMEGEEFKKIEIKIDELKSPPLIEITSPTKEGDLRGVKPFGINQLKTSNKEIQITVNAKSQGSGINEIRLYLNGKLVKTTQRGLKKTEQKDNSETKTFTISLTNGKNIIKATAFNTQQTESLPDEITIHYEGTKKTANLYMLVIGIDNYKNPRYKLNYALADATTFMQEIEKGSKDIFGSINIKFLKDENATRLKIMQEFENIKLNAKQEDVFIFYYAGHGVMSEENKPQFYLIPYDVTKLYGNNEMLKTKAISASELQTFSTELNAQKQMFIFDACQSGGMTELLAARGAAEEKAISQLARSTGTYWLTASNSEQFATEFAELGHGLFTYCVLLGLEGQADAGNKDNKITVKELSAFLDDKVPELSEKHKGTPQYPSIYGYGMDFPILIIKK